jgi:hypothetical protein
MLFLWFLLPFIYPPLSQAIFISQFIPILFGTPTTSHQLPHEDNTSLLLSIKGKREARVWLCPESCQNGIEVLFGTTNNQYVTIRDHVHITETSTFIYPLYHGNVLDQDEFRPFWIQWTHNELAVGWGHDVYRNMIIAYREDSLSASGGWTKTHHTYRLSFLSFSTWDEPIVFMYQIQKAIVQPYPTFSTSSEYEQFGQSYQFLNLSTDSFRIVFECQGLSECNLAFLRSYQWKTEDEHALELVLDDAFERRHLYSRSILRYGTGLGGRILAESRKSVLSSSQFRAFWISFHHGIVSVGRGIRLGKQALLTSPIQFKTKRVYLAFSNYFLASSIRILHVSSYEKRKQIILYDFNTKSYRTDKNTIVPLDFSYGLSSPIRPFVVSPQECPRLAQCKPPNYLHSISLPVTPRMQWWQDGAYCAEVSIQTALLTKGVYMSQGWIRSHSPYSGSKAFFGDSVKGYEIVPGNIHQALVNLGIQHEMWKGDNVVLFLEWVKHHLVQGHPVVWFVQASSSTYVEHAEPLLGYYSRHSLREPTVYPDDMIRYHSNIELVSFYRTMDSFVDMGNQKNCSLGISFGTEFISPHFQAAVAILGMNHPTLLVSISLSDAGIETKGLVYATLTIPYLEKGKQYVIIRNCPQWKRFTLVQAMGSTLVWKDRQAIRSEFYVTYQVKLVL